MNSIGIKNKYQENEEIDNESEKSKLKGDNIIKVIDNHNNLSNKNNCLKYFKFLLVPIVMLILFIFFFIIIYKNKETKESINKKEILNNSNQPNIKGKEKNKLIEKNNKKIGIAYVYSSLYANGVARFITVAANNLIKTGNYDISFITSNPYGREYTYNSSIKRFCIINNNSLIINLTKHENIDIFILQNMNDPPFIRFLHSIGKKVVGMFHGIFMSAMVFNHIKGYRNIINFDLLDSFVFISPDDYFFYKHLGFQNEIFIPNFLTFEPSETQNSNLTYNNIIMLGRLNDPVKGVEYAIRAMTLIIKEVPDAKLILISSDSRVQFLRDLIKELNLANSVFISSYISNISLNFWNSSVHMYTSLSEAFPLAMNEGKAHGLPIVAFDVPHSPPYQEGVILVDQLDYESLAKETIKLLKDYKYRKLMGEYAKKSLDKYSNKEIIEIWEKLFRALLSENKNDYRKLQKKIEEKYYNEEETRIRLQKSYEYMKKINKNITCHTLDNFIDINYIKNIEECSIIS